MKPLLSEQPPKRRLTLKLDLEADSLDELVRALRGVAFDIEFDGREERETTSGAPTAGFNLVLKCEPEMDHDKYVEALNEWRANRVR